MSAVAAQLALMIERASAGVDYRHRTGALCPCCGRPVKIYKTLRWEGNVRVRYHKCTNPKCLISAAGKGIKSVEVDE